MAASHSAVIEIDDDVRRAAERVAEREWITLSALVDRALRQATASGNTRSSRKHIPIPTDGEGGVAPGVDINDKAAVRAILDASPDHLEIPTFGEGGLLPGVDLSSNASVYAPLTTSFPGLASRTT